MLEFYLKKKKIMIKGILSRYGRYGMYFRSI